MEIELSDRQHEALDDIHLACYDAVENAGDIYMDLERLLPEVQDKVQIARDLSIPEAFILAVINRFTLKESL